jgi:hypothetical protein
MLMTLDLQPNADHRYTIDLEEGVSVPVYLADDSSQQQILTQFRGIPITLDRSNSFQLQYTWVDQAIWDVTVPAKPRPPAVFRRNGACVATAEFKFFRTWKVTFEQASAEPILLKLGWFYDRLVTQNGRRLAVSKSAPWSVKIPIALSSETDDQLGGLIGATYLLAIAYRHQIDGD